MFKLLEVLSLVKRGAILQCGRRSGRALPRVVTRHDRIAAESTLSTTLAKILIVRAIVGPTDLTPNLLEDFIWEVGRHFVLEDGDLLDHHLGILLSLAFLQLAQNVLKLLSHEFVLLHQVTIRCL